MALTPAQVAAHLVTLIRRCATEAPEIIPILIAAAMRYKRLGADQEDAALTVLKSIYQEQTGVDPTANATTRHAFKHWLTQAAEGADAVEA